jgi:hypothetical protein
MKPFSSLRPFGIILMIFVIAFPARLVLAQDAELVESLGKEIAEALGKDVEEFGGDEAAEQTARRLMKEATDAVGESGGRVANVQVKRIIARGDEAIIFDLKNVRGNSLPLLEDVSDEALPSAVETISRAGVAEGLESLGSMTLKKAALTAEMRLPGAGLKLIQHYGEEGAKVAGELTEDQANSLVAELRPDAVKRLPSAERAKLLNALSSRPDARVFNYKVSTGPLVVVAGGIVVWHAIDVTLSPDERVTEQPDGTVVRERTGVGSRLVQSFPQVATALSNPLKWAAITLATGVTLVSAFFIWLREKRAKTGGKQVAG